MFLQSQPSDQIESYKQLLRISGSLSKLFSENKTPYLNYRLAENIFCKAFGADNESRSDVSVDAVKGAIGIGLKTFLHKPTQFEKIAEFNKESGSYSALPDDEIVQAIAASRNKRIETTVSLYDLKDIIYHCVARYNGSFKIYEVPMQLINIDAIGKLNIKGTTIKFSDGLNDYSFYKSKSTLYKKFVPPANQVEFDVEIIEDPYALLEEAWNQFGVDLSKENENVEADHIILPLYSMVGPAGGHKEVPPASGLNLWNSDGRPRDFNEMYIRIPAWIHRAFDGFLPPKDQSFDLILPDKKVLSAKVCQAGGKALMSNPNKDLGEWLLRKVFNLKDGELLTYERMELAGIDSVAVYKNSDSTYEISLKGLGAFEKFEQQYNTVD